MAQKSKPIQVIFFIFLIVFLFLLGRNFLPAALTLSAQDFGDYPAECKNAGITEPARCAEYMAEYTREQYEPPLQEIVPQEAVAPPAICPADCGQCKICRNGECVLAPFGTPDIKNCGDKMVCDENGGCIQPENVVESDNFPPRQLDEAATTQRRSGEAAREENRSFNSASPEKQYFPPPCLEKGITDMRQCEQFLRSSGGTPSGEPGYLPPPCLKAGLKTAESCEEYMMKRDQAPKGDFQGLMPPPCQEAKIAEPAACFIYMKEQNGSSPDKFGPPGDFSAGPPADFTSFLPPDCQEAGLTEPEACQKLMFSLRMPQECREAPGIDTPEKCEKHIFQKFAPPECKNISSPQECEKIMIAKRLPPDCKTAGAATPEECHKYMSRSMMPKVCAEKGATSEFECEKIVFATYGKPKDCQGLSDTECRIAITEGRVEAKELMEKMKDEIPPRCRELGAKDFADCERLMMKRNLPPECRTAGAFTQSACERVMMEKYAPKPDQLPRPCQEAGAATPQECEKIMIARFMPQECKDGGISDRESCERFLAQKYMPKECLDAGAYKREDCEKIMRVKYLAPACKEQGINEEETCRRFMEEKYAKKFQCEGISEDECLIAIKTRHLGQIVKKELELKEVKEKIKEFYGRHLSLGRRALTPGQDEANAPRAAEENPSTSNEADQSASEQPEQAEEPNEQEEIEKSLPFANNEEATLLVLTVEEINIVQENETLITTLPAAVAIDDDEDGVPNDLEKRLGSNPERADSDNDGFDDHQEITNGFNPAGEGNLDYETQAFEENILKNQSLDQPIISGEEAARVLTVDAAGAESIEPSTEQESQPSSWLKKLLREAYAQKPSAGVLLKGKGPANTLIAIYIYSELPIIGTARTDAQGNWQYLLDKQLKDGNHTVYTATTDQRGNILKKSRPFSLLIKQARAATPREFIEKPPLTETSPSRSSFWLLLSVLAAGIIFVGGGATFFFLKKKS